MYWKLIVNISKLLQSGANVVFIQPKHTHLLYYMLNNLSSPLISRDLYCQMKTESHDVYFRTRYQASTQSDTNVPR